MVSEKLKLFREVLSLRNYAPQTIKTYEKAVSSFYAFSDGSRPTQQTLYNYALYFKEKNYHSVTLKIQLWL